MKSANTIKKRTLLAIFAVAALSLTLASPAAAITWGQPDETAHPNVGAMVVNFPGYGPLQWCSGTLIHERVFLTAGHCVANLDAYGISTVWVNFDQDAMNLGTLVAVANWWLQPDYDWKPRSNTHDVAALILPDPVDGITPATLPERGYLDGLKKDFQSQRHGWDSPDFTVVGYGGTLSWPPSPPEDPITYEDKRQYATSEYQALLKSWLRLSQNQAQGDGDGGTCYGDSGGPAFWNDPQLGDVLVGVTSWGDARCVATGFYYRTDTADTLDFVADVIAGLNGEE